MTYLLLMQGVGPYWHISTYETLADAEVAFRREVALREQDGQTCWERYPMFLVGPVLASFPPGATPI